jgi:predicted nucleic acid-binding protein
MRIALDTNAYSALMRGHRDVAALIRRSEAVLVPAVVVGELSYGFRLGSRFEENAARLEAFLAAPSVDLLPVTIRTADRFGRIAAALRQLSQDGALCHALGQGARAKVAREGLWSSKASAMVDLYSDITANHIAR